MKLILSYNGM